MPDNAIYASPQLGLRIATLCGHTVLGCVDHPLCPACKSTQEWWAGRFLTDDEAATSWLKFREQKLVVHKLNGG